MCVEGMSVRLQRNVLAALGQKGLLLLLLSDEEELGEEVALNREVRRLIENLARNAIFLPGKYYDTHTHTHTLNFWIQHI